jgi:pimeloyl-ACP methyl ester carboxylesterase
MLSRRRHAKAQLAHVAGPGLPDLAARFFADVAEPPASTSLRVDVPALVLWGMQDPVCLPGLLDGLHDYAPNAIVVRIDDAGHLPMQSHPILVKSCNPRLSTACTSQVVRLLRDLRVISWLSLRGVSLSLADSGHGLHFLVTALWWRSPAP